jgi:hypothetical protein
MLWYKIIEASHSDSVFGFYEEGRMIAVILIYKLKDFLNHNTPKSRNSKLFHIMRPYIEQIRQTISEVS